MELCRLCGNEECETDLDSLLCATEMEASNSEYDIFAHMKTYLDCYRFVAMTEVQINEKISHKLCNNCSKQLLSTYNFIYKAYHVERKLQAMLKSKEYPPDPIEVPNNRDDLLLALTNGDFMETCGQIVNEVLLKVNVNANSDMQETATTTATATPTEDLGIECDKIQEASEISFENLSKKPRKTTSVKESKEDVEEDDYEEQTICYACNGLEFDTQNEIKQHLIHAHMSIVDKMKVCDLCGEGCRSRPKFMAHMRTHNTLRNTLKCSMCKGKEFANPHDYMEHKIDEHMLKNVEDNHFECKNCQTDYISLYNLRRHLVRSFEKPMREHFADVNVEEMSCKICNKKCTRMNSLLRHVQTHKQVRKTSTCNICDKTFFLESSMQAHKLKHEQQELEIISYKVEFASDMDKDLKCNICNKQFVKKVNLEKHLEKHQVILAENRAGPFRCHQCEKTYMCKKYLDQHLRRHFNANFACEFCEKKFVSKKELLEHTRCHTGDYPFICEICGKRYGVKISLTDHLMKHQGVRFKCEECGKCFIKRGTLREHSYLHTGKMPYPCVYCDRGYTSKDKYRYHLKHKHGLELTDEEHLKSRKLFAQKHAVVENSL